ncbi:MAG TPA: GH1 family beta-glucosidase [Chitinophagales bacterium]|nr:GH1 family beta-glucosidase [Chitinophagales bacterium]HMX60785.1 GH1 family beta-glucosidase [Chitinophagales bacterium]HMZ34699.1 GH1 family beta-glucosidase [Chitinophagales bacterium]HNA39399.1 GH1 family beta-glucosidase [Chitinophagales bacterium]HNB49187.1 GH1 family beta-glucosidase [Chitinophagales bacterium]
MNRSEFLKLCAILGIGSTIPKSILANDLFNDLRSSDFGNDFVWGTATASYQIEGAWNVDGKGESIWDRFAHQPRNIKTKENGDVACDFYNRYNEDIELMRDMHIKHSRFSISWPRLLPEGTGKINQKGIDFYDRVIDKYLKENITPWATLYHWDLPQKLQDKGGWENRDILGWFEEYVSLCAHKFGDRVKNWMVFNEPGTFVPLGYLIKIHAPGKFGFNHFLPALHHVSLAHGVGGRVLKNVVKDGNIGTTFSCSHVDPYKNNERFIQSAKRMDAFTNRLYIEPILGLGYPTAEIPKLKKMEKYFKPDDEKNLPFDFDFIGLQNYSRIVSKPLQIVPGLHAMNVKAKKLGHDITEMGWEVYPEGMYKIIKQIAAYKNIKKIYITENGVAFKDSLVNGNINDTNRIQFLKDYLKQILRAKKEGVDIGGYFVWSFMDNFEWAEGYHPRFGLVHVDFKTQQRIIKDSGKWFSEFLQK